MTKLSKLAKGLEPLTAASDDVRFALVEVENLEASYEVSGDSNIC